MENRISKSKFKPNALKFFREIEETGKELIITNRSKPVLKIIPFQEKEQTILKELRNSVEYFENPLDPVAEEDWEVLS